LETGELSQHSLVDTWEESTVQTVMVCVV